jgi:methylglutamate dehydrogenase subunit B
MLIRCPHCGDRISEEFTALGDATVIRPASNDPDTMDQWFDYVFIRPNPKGRHREYFQHTGGCRAWLVVERDTVTHESFSVEDARTANPKMRAEAAAKKTKRSRA